MREIRDDKNLLPYRSRRSDSEQLKIMKTKTNKTNAQKIRTLLTFSNPKTQKNLKFGIATAIMHLSPHKISGRNLCPKASDGCISNCLNKAGNPVYQKGKDKARLERSQFFIEREKEFFQQLRKEIVFFSWKAFEAGLTPSFRLNGTSDIPKVAFKMAREFPNFQFSDYTKILATLKNPKRPENYHLTFSRSESNWAECLQAFKLGVNVAAVVDSEISDSELREFLDLPESIRIENGDDDDATFLRDELQLIRLTPKGKMKFDETGMRIRREMLKAKKTKSAIARFKMQQSSWAVMP